MGVGQNPTHKNGRLNYSRRLQLFAAVDFRRTAKLVDLPKRLRGIPLWLFSKLRNKTDLQRLLLINYDAICYKCTRVN